MRPFPVQSPLAILGVSLLALLCGGCAVSDRPVDDGPPVQFDDVAVPDGMVLKSDLNESYSRQTLAERIGHFEYYGPGTVDERQDYMRRRMPLNGWELIDEKTEAGGVELTFDKHPDISVCRIWKDESDVLRMVVDVRPKLP